LSPTSKSPTWRLDRQYSDPDGGRDCLRDALPQTLKSRAPMTSFFTLNSATENIGSEFPQIETMGTGYDYQAAESVYRIREMDLDNQSPNLKTFTVAARARRLDLMSAVP